MKKFVGIIFIVSMVLLLTFSTVSAKKMTNIKGTVTAVNGDLVTVKTNKDISYDVYVPDDFDGVVSINDEVLIKAESLDDGTWQALSFKLLHSENGDVKKDEPEIEEEEDIVGTKLNSAFCDPEKQGKPHPLAITIAERYGVEEEWVMEHYCNGNSIGSIMLALKTSSFEDVDIDADTLLETHSNGNGWGQIWQEMKLIGKDKEWKTPPGQLNKKKPDK